MQVEIVFEEQGLLKLVACLDVAKVTQTMIRDQQILSVLLSWGFLRRHLEGSPLRFGEAELRWL